MNGVLERKMVEPKRKRGRPKGERTDATVKIDKRLVGMAKVVAVHRGESLAELLSGMLEGPIEKAYVNLMALADKNEPKAK